MQILSRIAGFLARNLVPVLFALIGSLYSLAGVVILVWSAQWFVNSPDRVELFASNLLVLPFGVALVLIAAGLHARRRDVWYLAIGLIVAFSFTQWAPLSAIETDDTGNHLDMASLVVNGLLLATLVMTGRRYIVHGSLLRGRLYLMLGAATALLAALYLLLAIWLLNSTWEQSRTFQPGDTSLDVSALTRLQLISIWVLIVIVLSFLMNLFRMLRGTHERMEPEAVRTLLGAHGADTLDYFVTNEKKRHYVWRQDQGLVGYEIVNGIALASGDPICAPENLDAIIEDFIAEMERFGYEVTFWAVSDTVVASLDRRGWAAMKLGEEATVDVSAFDVDALGSQGSDLKRAARSVEARGIEFAFYRMEEVPGLIYSKMEELDRDWIAEFGGGSEERGFSMTLSRLPTFEDIDAAFAVAVDHSSPENPTVVAYLSLVPVYNRNSYSLDMMRRTTDAPNGINDFLLLHTLQIIRYHGRRSFSLNFAPLANTGGEQTLLAKAASSLPDSLKKTLYIDTLYAFNDKFGPQWHARHAAFRGTRNIIPVIRAVAKLEGSIEIDWRRRLAERVAGPGHAVVAARR